MAATNTAFTQSPEHRGWQATLKLGFKNSGVKTVLAERYRRGPLAVQRALYPEGDVCHVYLLHPPGGVVGGDRLDISVDLQQGAHALLTTPGATKFYRSAGESALQTQVFNVAENATLEWLPQENIFFPGALLQSRLQLNLAGNAKAAVWEIQCLGRPVNNEAFDQGYLDSHWLVYRDGKAVLIERLRLDKAIQARLSQLQGHAVSGTFLLTNIDKEQLDELRSHQLSGAEECLAMTLLDDILLVRYMGDSTENARRYFAAIWSQVREKSFTKTALVPRIWNT